MNYYAVKKGRKEGIYYNWDDCKEQVNGYPNAEFKKFKTKEEAEEFITGKVSIKQNTNTETSDIEDVKLDTTISKDDNIEDNEKCVKVVSYPLNRVEFNKDGEAIKCPSNEIIAYVDGSFRKKDQTYSYGAILFNDNIYETGSKRFYKKDVSMRNVSGEIEGAMYAMKRAIQLGKDKVYIHYDYAGIENWALGNWKANKKGTIAYKQYYNEMKKYIDIEFIKVKAHSGIKYNELVDQLAKDAE